LTLTIAVAPRSPNSSCGWLPKEQGMLIGLPRELLDEEAGRIADRASSDGLICIVGSELG